MYLLRLFLPHQVACVILHTPHLSPLSVGPQIFFPSPPILYFCHFISICTVSHLLFYLVKEDDFKQPEAVVIPKPIKQHAPLSLTHSNSTMCGTLIIFHLIEIYH